MNEHSIDGIFNTNKPNQLTINHHDVIFNGEN